VETSEEMQFAFLEQLQRHQINALLQRKSTKRKPEKEEQSSSVMRKNSFVLVCSLSSHRHLFIPLIFGSRFVDS